MIAVIDSGVANLESVMAALRRLNADAEITADAGKIKAARHVILPGVGAAAAVMGQLRAKKIIDTIKGLTQPVLGICLGMQLLFESSAESGSIECLGLMPGRVEPLNSHGLPVPHMGWNTLRSVRPHPLLQNIADESFVYFVHSFAAPVSAASCATADYGATFTAVAARDNFSGCQFHPERSGAVGQKIIENFLGL